MFGKAIAGLNKIIPPQILLPQHWFVRGRRKWRENTVGALKRLEFVIDSYFIVCYKFPQFDLILLFIYHSSKNGSQALQMSEIYSTLNFLQLVMYI